MNPEEHAQKIAFRQLQTLLEAQIRLRRAAEARAQETRKELERVAEALCPEEVDRIRRRSPEGLAGLPSRRVAEMVLAARLSRPKNLFGEDLARRCAEAEDRLRVLQARLREAEARAARAEAEAARLREQLRPVASSPNRQRLVRAAANLLIGAGWEVNPRPGPLPAPDGGAFQPELTIRLGGRWLPVEVEDLSRTPAERETRWAACHAVGGGHLLFVAPDPGTLDRLRSEVFFWAGSRPLKLWMTDLERGRGRQGEAVWLIRRG